MPEQPMTKIDVVIRFWAVIGPLLTAGISAWWARFNQDKDRAFDKVREIEREALQREAKERDHRLQVHKEKYIELKTSIVNFMGSTYEYVRRQNDYFNYMTPEKQEAAAIANDKFIYSCQMVVLLGNEELADCALQLWNATLSVPGPPEKRKKPEFEMTMATYRSVRSEFNKLARRQLAQLEAAPLA